MEELRKIAMDAGSDVSESNFFEQSWQQSYWRLNYPLLQAAKAKSDLLGLFFVHHGVDKEEWGATALRG
jgi:berberine-like enzyme